MTSIEKDSFEIRGLAKFHRHNWYGRERAIAFMVTICVPNFNFYAAATSYSRRYTCDSWCLGLSRRSSQSFAAMPAAKDYSNTAHSSMSILFLLLGVVNVARCFFGAGSHYSGGNAGGV